MIRNLLRAAVLGGGAYYLFRTEQGKTFRQGLMGKVKGYVDSLGLTQPQEGGQGIAHDKTLGAGAPEVRPS